MSTLLTPGRAVKWIGDDGGWKVGKVLGGTGNYSLCWGSACVACVQALDGVHLVDMCDIQPLALRSEYEAAE